MDGSRFDNLTRSLAISRRGVLKQLAAGILAGASGLVGAGVADAQTCVGIRRRCTADGDCCDGFCDPATSRCACPTGTEECDGYCVSPDYYQSSLDNCGRCRMRCRRASECNEPVCVGGVCGEAPDSSRIGGTCGPLGGGVYGVCAADGACVCPPDLPTQCANGCVDTLSDPQNCGACGNRCRREPGRAPVCTNGVCEVACKPGYFECGGDCCSDARNCCDGVCCGPGQCCFGGLCSADSCAPHCVIDGEWIADGTINPNNACEVCDRDRNETTWSTVASGTLCGEPGQCCNLGLCQDCGCQIAGAQIASGALNPENPCEVCDPVQDATGWSPLTGDDCGDFSTCCEGVCCGPEQCCNENFICEDCRCVIDGFPRAAGEINWGHDCEHCDPSQSTSEWSHLPDRTDCGSVSGRICCNGACCAPTECCTATGCEECGEICRIDDRDVPAMEQSPDDPCQICDPQRRHEDWSEAPDDFVCGGDLDDVRVCCRGRCCDADECCDDGCKPCRCRIGGFPWDKDTRNPLNHCQVCDPERSQEEWSPANNGAACGAGDERECCEGECCPAGQCCNGIGECEPCPCRINGQDWLDGAHNPSNTCQVCDPEISRDAWTLLGDHEACGTEDDDRVCCNGTCCPQGQCCEDGVCINCGCEIDGNPISAGTINEDNVCQICDPTRARLTWSPVDNGTTCGADGERCCGGDCCESDECCILDACGTCLCQIDGGNVPAETVNPDNACEVCDPESEPFGWSPATDGTACGDDRVCCAGSCCDPGLCCNLGICQFCGCLIGEDQVPEFTVNPDNECQWCDPVLDPLGWSARSDEPCGDGGEQVCCDGSCCGRGYCCDLNGFCAPCPCEIGGVTYAPGTANPLNACEVCDSLTNRFDWTNAPDNSTCGLTDDRFCCAGSCCSGGECCHALDAACGPEPCHCTIGEDEIAEGEPNPANECERCDPREDPAGWSPLADDTACGETGNRVCCLGTCCEEGACCNLGVCGLCGCLIETQTYEADDPNPANACQKCDPVLDPFDWSPVDDETTCGIVQVCCGGECCGPNACCGVGGRCEDCNIGCRIGGVAYASGAGNPLNPCEVCDPSVSSVEWAPVANGTICGEFEDQVCCNGVCCVERGGCCIENECMIDGCPDRCEEDPSLCRCLIGSVEYPDGAINPGNPCEQCRYWEHPGRWSAADDHSPCGSNGEQYCCGGACCGAGECCSDDGFCLTGGSSACNGCDIDGRFYPITARKPDNPCLWCAPFYSTTEWTKRDNHATCGASGDQNCCDGVCCAPGLCCTGTSVGGTCEPCGCEINGGSYVPGQINPANWCQHCDPALSMNAWSISEAQFCSFDFSRDCCNGVCCLPTTCCGFGGVCEPMLPDVSNCVNWQF